MSFGPLVGTVVAGDDAALSSSAEEFGSSLAAGDADTDGIDDVVVGATSDAAYLFLGPVTADQDTTAADAVFGGGAPEGFLSFDIEISPTSTAMDSPTC